MRLQHTCNNTGTLLLVCTLLALYSCPPVYMSKPVALPHIEPGREGEMEEGREGKERGRERGRDGGSIHVVNLAVVQ